VGVYAERDEQQVQASTQRAATGAREDLQEDAMGNDQASKWFFLPIISQVQVVGSLTDNISYSVKVSSRSRNF
jgi:hypothetical protein